MMKKQMISITTALCVVAMALVCMTILMTEPASAASDSFANQKPKITVVQSGDGTEISWSKVANARAYRVYRSYSKDGKYTRLKTIMASTGSLSYKDAKAKSGQVAYYKVRAYKGMLKFKTYTKYSSKKSIRTVTRVFVACGHGTDIAGRWDTGCTYRVKSTTLTEAGLMLPITKAFVQELRNSGVYVYSDVDKGNNKNMIACVAWANMKDISAYISIHCDYSKAKTGTLPLYVGSKGKALAKSLNKGVHSKVSIADRGLSYRSDLYELTQTDAPACIYETGSIKEDYKLFQKQSETYGQGLAKGLCEYIGVSYVEPQKQDTSKSSGKSKTKKNK